MRFNLKKLNEYAMPKGVEALDPIKRTMHQLECYESMSPMLTLETMPNQKFKRLERWNNALMMTPTSQMFSSQSDLLLNNLESDAGEIEGVMSEITDLISSDIESTFRIIDTLNQSYSVVPGG